MSDPFLYDVFLSCGTKDKDAVREIAQRLRSDGLRIWFEEWQLKPATKKTIRSKKIEAGLEQARTLVLCLSTKVSNVEGVRQESYTFRFCDPQNAERRFIQIQLDEMLLPESRSQNNVIFWQEDTREQEYARLLESCRPPAVEASIVPGQYLERAVQLDTSIYIHAYAFSPDVMRVITGSEDKILRLWDLEKGWCIRELRGHMNTITCVAWNIDENRAISGSIDNTVRLWDLKAGKCLRTLRGHTKGVLSIAWSADGCRILSGSSDHTVRLWDLEIGKCLRVFGGHTSAVSCVAWSPDGRRALSGSNDNTVRLWDVETGDHLRVLEGHIKNVYCVAWSGDGHHALTGSKDRTVRLWDVDTGECLRVFEGHTEEVRRLTWRDDGKLALTGGSEGTIGLWDVDTGYNYFMVTSHEASIRGLGWSADGRHAFSGDQDGNIRIWDLLNFVAGWRVEHATSLPTVDQSLYTNAKVLLVGDTSAGKTGLSMRLALNKWEPTDSTVGAWATHWKLEGPHAAGSPGTPEREIWLWDFGGQADQRLIHQLYMEDTALAVLVFDGQKANLFESLGQWDRDLTRASTKPFSRLLVAGRVDAGGLRVSRSQVETFANERGYTGFLETSAKMNIGCQELKEAILSGIRWENLPWRSSPRLFKRLKEEILHLKDEGRVLMRFNELRDALRLRLGGLGESFKDEELKAVVGLLAGPGVVWELAFGSWVLLQPERINAYAQSVIQTLRADPFERGCLPEERVLNGELDYHASMQRLEPDEERFVLLAMLQTLVARSLCLREQTGKGPLLIFPSYYRRERPEMEGHPAVLVSYRFNGFLDDIYATLVVKLHYIESFKQDQLWLYAADFTTLTGKLLGVKLTRRAEGAGELEVYFDPAIPLEVKIIFSRYVHEHLLRKAQEVVRLRYYVCPYCGTPVGNREVAMERLGAWLDQEANDMARGRGLQAGQVKSESPTILCVRCEQRVPLWDEMEECFASPEIRQKVHELQEQVAIVLDSESKERTLVGDVITTVALAGQICREYTVSDWGIDMEIEFKDDAGRATGRKLYLQLKSGDSYLRKRKADGEEIFTIKGERHARYWMDQAFPVLLVIRTSEGEVRWMEVRDWLKRVSLDGKKQVKQIIFEGERFDVMSVRRWRERLLNKV